MKVLFLDIDGVCNHLPGTPCSTDKAGRMVMTDPEKVFMVNKLADLYEIQVVLSSSWKNMPEWRESMKAQGFVFKFMDRTPNKAGMARGYEIKQWLTAHPEVTRYAILDDDDDMLPEQQDSFFKTDPAVGITEDLIKEVTNHLLCVSG